MGPPLVVDSRAHSQLSALPLEPAQAGHLGGPLLLAHPAALAVEAQPAARHLVRARVRIRVIGLGLGFGLGSGWGLGLGLGFGRGCTSPGGIGQRGRYREI